MFTYCENYDNHMSLKRKPQNDYDFIDLNDLSCILSTLLISPKYSSTEWDNTKGQEIKSGSFTKCLTK